MSRPTYACLCAVAVGLGCAKPPQATPRGEAVTPVAGTPSPQRAAAPQTPAATLFDGSSLDGWKVLADDAFPGRGKVGLEDGAIVMEAGDPFTGVAWTGTFATGNYEIELEARRVAGKDIFCGLTFPVGDEHVTIVLGGWGNCLVGLSNIDGHNASENISTRSMSFDNGRWYTLAVRVTDERIQAWIDDENVVDVERGDHRFTVYDQLLPTRPIGVFTWRTTGEIRKMSLKPVRSSALD